MRLYPALLLTLFLVSTIQADDHAVSLIYHHVSEDTPALTSVSPNVFEQHLDYLDEHNFNIWPLSRILDTLRKGQDLPGLLPRLWHSAGDHNHQRTPLDGVNCRQWQAKGRAS